VQYGGCGVSNAQAGIEGHQRLTSIKSWTITDGGLAICQEEFRPFITMWALPSTLELSIPTQGVGYDFEIERGDGTTGKHI
jgi:hypothetical protein